MIDWLRMTGFDGMDDHFPPPCFDHGTYAIDLLGISLVFYIYIYI